MLSICSDSLKGYGLNRIFEIVKEAGFDGLDLNIDPRNYDTLDAEYIKSLISEHQLPVLSISTPGNANPAKIKEAIEIAKTINCKIVIIQPPKIFDFKYISWLKNEIPKLRQKENISIALENSPSDTLLGFIPSHSMNSVVELKNFKHVCLDTTRVAQKKEDLIRIYKSLKKYLVHVHLSNVKAGILYSAPESGILPLESFLTKLKQDGYPGTISFKINPKFLDLDDRKKMMKTLAKHKDFYDTYFTNIATLPPETSTS